jgi:hypothetical protein
MTGWANPDVPASHSSQTPLIMLLDMDPDRVVILKKFIIYLITEPLYQP